MTLSLKPFAAIEALGVLLVAGVAVFSVPELAALLAAYIFYKILVGLPLIRHGLITRFFIAFLLIFSLNTLIGFFAWAVDIKITFDRLVIGYSLLSAALVLLWPKNLAGWRLRGAKITKNELLALALVIPLFWLMLSPLMPKHTAIQNTRVITYGGDNISHLEFLRVVGENQGYVQDHYLDLKDTLSAKLIPYPQGWHLNLSIIKRAAEGLIGPLNLAETLYFYQLASATGLAVLAYFFVLVSLGLHRLVNRQGRMAAYLSVALLGGLLFAGPFFTFFALGSQTQIAAMVLFLAMLLLLFEAPNLKDEFIQKLLLGLALVLATGIAYAWFFLWPVALATVAIFAHEILELKSWAAIKASRRFVALASLVGLGGAGQLFFQIAYAPERSTINEPGFLPEPNNWLLLALLLVVVIFGLRTWSALRPRLVFKAIIAAVAFSLAILAYQLITVGELRYYYYKSTYTFVLLGAVFLSLAATQFIFDTLRGIRTTRLGSYLLAAALAGTVASLVWVASPKDFRLYAEQKPYGMSEELSDAVITIATQNAADGHRVVAIGSCNREYDIKAMRLATAYGGKPNYGQQEVIEAQIRSPKAGVTFKAIKQYLDKENSLIAVSTDYRLQQRLADYLGNDNARVRFVDLDRIRSQKTPVSCPHLLR